MAVVESSESAFLASTGRFHHESIRDPGLIRSLLERLRREGVHVHFRVSRAMLLETGRIEEIGAEQLLLRVRNFERENRDAIIVNFELEDVPYFFSATHLDASQPPILRLRIPDSLYRSERRERVRRPGASERPAPTRVALEQSGRVVGEGIVADFSPVGLGLEVGESTAQTLDRAVSLRFLDGPWAGEQRWAEVRYRARPDGRGWVRLGLAVTSVTPTHGFPVEKRERILPSGGLRRIGQGAAFLAAGVRFASTKALLRITGRDESLPAPNVVDYENELGERLRAIVDSTGPTEGALAVIIPPAWGRTKETLSPLAAVLKESFRRAGISAVVVRFDGIRRRGESHNDPDCLAPGKEQLRYTLSQGVSDIMATLSFLESSPHFRTTRSILVTFSAAALDGRKAVAWDKGRRIQGWVSVVGMPELQNCMRVISGGVDYPVAVERGLNLGIEEILGVPIDVDTIVGDAVRNGFAYVEDARRDMAQIQVPVTWIHGRYDAWMNINTVREILACGETKNRTLLEVPTGHQLSTSREALEVFQLIATEAGRMALGRPLRAALPRLTDLERRQRSERARLVRPKLDLLAFWNDFLLGRDKRIGVEWLGATSAYRQLMKEQIEALSLGVGERVADLGAGTGPFALQLAFGSSRPSRVTVDEVDFVQEGLLRARTRFRSMTAANQDLAVRYVVCNLESEGGRLPFRRGAYDAVLASLVLSYLADPQRLLASVHEVLRPGGRLVLSTLKRDADLSKLYVDAIAELRAGRAREVFGEGAEELVIRSAPQFLNEASRLLDFEEQGAFHFWDREELVRFVQRVGFRDVSARYAFGDPPQAILLSARRP